MEYSDLRGFISAAKTIGQLKIIEGADWRSEIGAITFLAKKKDEIPALLFRKIKDYPEDYKILANAAHSLKRLALILRTPMEDRPIEFIKSWKERMKKIDPIPAKKVKDGPVLENMQTGKDVDIYKFPTPKWHELDGGRYIGTGNIVITRDPDEGWVNLGTYRVMIHDKDTLAFYISPGKHGRIHREKYFSRKQNCKVAISFGHDPLLTLVGGTEQPYGVCEYDYAGGICGHPIEVIEGEYTGLPIPAHSEIAIEGEGLFDESRLEGPFGEWTGYYASSTRNEPVIKIKNIMHRDNPILLGYPPSRVAPSATLRSALIWNELETMGLPDVKGVWCHPYAGHRLFTVISIKQRYPGHAKQAVTLASQCHAGAYTGRYVVVVDDDIDPSNINDVIWAMATRSDPAESIDILRRCWSGALDPFIPMDKKGHNSKALIEATRPYERLKDFPIAVDVSKGLAEKVTKKWNEVLKP
ncbi:UbiD family decarboxylase [Thermodesulfobacteriota bacterium]